MMWGGGEKRKEEEGRRKREKEGEEEQTAESEIRHDALNEPTPQGVVGNRNLEIVRDRVRSFDRNEHWYECPAAHVPLRPPADDGSIII